MKLPAALLVIALVAGACTSSEGVNAEPGINCVSNPPPSALEIEVGFDISLEPNSVRAGQEAQLLVSQGLTDDTIGPHAGWACWDGSEWVGTHMLFAENPPSVLEVEPGVPITVTGAAVILPAELTIRIPEVDPGTYRLAVSTTTIDGDLIAGSTLVQVVSATLVPSSAVETYATSIDLCRSELDDDSRLACFDDTLFSQPGDRSNGPAGVEEYTRKVDFCRLQPVAPMRLSCYDTTIADRPDY